MPECQDLLGVRWGLLSAMRGGTQTPPLVTASSVLLIRTMTCPTNTGAHISFHMVATCMCTQHNKILRLTTTMQPRMAICISGSVSGGF